MKELIINYWVEWLLGLIALGLLGLAKHYISLQKKDFTNKWKEREDMAKTEVIDKLENEIADIIERSDKADKKINGDIEALYLGMEALNTGVLSIQGKQFRDFCAELLLPDHEISIIEYEQFEEDYEAYKALGGNHRGDALHDRVVDKFSNQVSK